MQHVHSAIPDGDDPPFPRRVMATLPKGDAKSCCRWFVVQTHVRFAAWKHIWMSRPRQELVGAVGHAKFQSDPVLAR